jgi:putative heme iron utilization protein
MSTIEEARAFLFGACHGALATRQPDGDPFASATNLVADNNGRILLLVSRLAEHAVNLDHAPECSLLLINRDEADWQAAPRMSLVGGVDVVDNAEGERYLSLFPHTREYLALDFHFLAFRISKVRWIPGFARACWLDGADVGFPLTFDHGREMAIVRHMNDDHADALRHYMALAGWQGDEVSLAALDSWGMWLRVDGTPRRLAFAEPAFEADAIRDTLVAMARQPLP